MKKAQYGIVLLVGLIAGFFGGVLSTRVFPPALFKAKIIQAKQFEVIRDGKRLAKLNLEGLSLFDEMGSSNAGLSSTSLWLVHDDSQTHVLLDSTLPSLTFSRGKEQRRAELTLWPNEEPHLRFYDKAGTVTWAAPDQEHSADAGGQLNPPVDASASSSSFPESTPAAAPKEKIPHPACPTCFTYRGDYQIFEEVPETGQTISRLIPNPAPGRPQGIQKDRHGEPRWFIGNQAFSGSTDEEPVSKELPLSLIQVQRIQARHMQEIMSIPGVHGFGIGAKGFIVTLLPEHRDNEKQIPKEIEGIPVEVEVRPMARLLSAPVVNQSPLNFFECLL